jgi:hypothetical protein
MEEGNTTSKMRASPRLVRYMIMYQVGQCVGTVLTVIILLTQLVLSGTVVTLHTTCLTYFPTTVFMHFVFPE